MAYSRSEIEEALEAMDQLRAESSKAGDWSIWAQCLTEDVDFYDVIYGRYRGRQAVSDFVVRVHAPFPHLRYERDWTMIDVDRGEVLFQQRMILPEPKGWAGDAFATEVWSRHHYGGGGLWSSKQDVTLSESASAANFGAWMKAGGRFAAPPLDPSERVG